MNLNDEIISNDKSDKIQNEKASFKSEVKSFEGGYLNRSNSENSFRYKKIASALFYALASMMIMFSNKIVLTKYNFSSFQALALGQIIISLVLLEVFKQFGLIKMNKFDSKTAFNLIPLSTFYFGNIYFGLGGTKLINLPMFTVLRRFSILMTMYGEIFLLKLKKPLSIQFSVYIMVFGTLLAALNDFSFNLLGYSYTMINNLFTAGNGILTKKKFNNMKLNEYDLMYYNSLLTFLPMLLLSLITNEYQKIINYNQWLNSSFLFFFLLSCLMGFFLNYSWMLCTKFNSPLTTSVIGCLKNILVTYFGMFIGGDYKFSNLNFVGLTISSIASVVYSYYTFMARKSKENLQETSDSNKLKISSG